MSYRLSLLVFLSLILSGFNWNIATSTNVPNAITTSISKTDLDENLEAYSILGNYINSNALEYAMNGYNTLRDKGQLGNNKYLTIIDMSKSSNEKRFFVINMESFQIETTSLVAHGKNTGEEYATDFSNKIGSYKSSYGFFTISEMYSGKHGSSLRLDGLEYCNNNARVRALVIHNADYVSENFIKKNNRLGRSYGCPALPKENYDKIISKIKNGSCLFIYYPDKTYLKKSTLIKPEKDNIVQYN